MNEPFRARFFSQVPIGAYFYVPGYDNLFSKVDARRAKNHGCGLLSTPVSLGRKGSVARFESETLVTS